MYVSVDHSPLSSEVYGILRILRARPSHYIVLNKINFYTEHNSIKIGHSIMCNVYLKGFNHIPVFDWMWEKSVAWHLCLPARPAPALRYSLNPSCTSCLIWYQISVEFMNYLKSFWHNLSFSLSIASTPLRWSYSLLIKGWTTINEVNNKTFITIIYKGLLLLNPFISKH